MLNIGRRLQERAYCDIDLHKLYEELQDNPPIEGDVMRIDICVSGLTGKRVELGITAPAVVKIVRAELAQQIGSQTAVVATSRCR